MDEIKFIISQTIPAVTALGTAGAVSLLFSRYSSSDRPIIHVTIWLLDVPLGFYLGLRLQKKFIEMYMSDTEDE